MSSSTRQPTLVLLGVNHTTAPLDVRERLAIPLSRLADATRALAHQPGIHEAMILSTCNRVELLTVQEEIPDVRSAHPGMLQFLHSYLNLPASTVRPHVYEFREREAVRHLFRVACSLDSLVVGEAQILGQVKDSWTIARDIGAISSTLDPLLQRAFSVAKKVRTETRIGSSSVSIASVAVDLARKIFGDLKGKQVLIVGAGKMSELAARHLIQHGASSLLIANRTESRARDIASRLSEQFASSPIATTILPFDQLHEHAHRADVVITSTGAGSGVDAPSKIFTPAHGRLFLERRRNRPMFFIDIAVPRDVDPALNEVEGCFVYDIDDLQQVAAANLANRSREAAAAEAIVAHEVEAYQHRLSGRPAIDAIKALQESAEDIRQAELARSASRLSGLSRDQMAVVETLTRSLMGKLLHPQIAALRAKVEEGDSADALSSAQSRPSSEEKLVK